MKCTIEANFRDCMAAIKVVYEAAYEDFMSVGLNKFCRLYINTWPKCEVVDNNMSECFNGYILKARSKPLIDMLEDIRVSIMQRMCEKKEFVNTCTDNLCPRVRKSLEKNKLLSRFCIATRSGQHWFEVTNGADRFVVDVMGKTCACRLWDLTGIPCPHAISCIYWLKQDPDDFVDDALKMSTYIIAYESGIPPLNGKRMWPPVEGQMIHPPQILKKVGRPKKNRKKDMFEKEANPDVASKKGVLMKCNRCGKVGHNVRTCKQKGKLLSVLEHK